jgi:hypothetical protein
MVKKFRRRNVGNHLQDYKASQPRRPQSTVSQGNINAFSNGSGKNNEISQKR